MRITIVDVFADAAFSGNPAGVCILGPGSWPSEDWMRHVASELNQPATAFARPSDSMSTDWELRWLTPVTELGLCGHATLAAAHVLQAVDQPDGKFRFGTRSGTIRAEVTISGTVSVDLPMSDLTEASLPDGLAAAIGFVPTAVFHTGRLRDLLMVLRDEQEVCSAEPDLAAIARITDREGLRGVAITASAATGIGYDFVSRFFDPGEGVPEDHVTGSIHTALAPYWAARLGRAHLTGFQASTRGGTVRVRVEDDNVRLSGRCVTVLEGRLQVE